MKYDIMKFGFYILALYCLSSLDATILVLRFVVISSSMMVAWTILNDVIMNRSENHCLYKSWDSLESVV